ncbi:hypothetical protein RO21_06125 [[Actinobacillus] muris]|uniref:Uncharacterized protein n=1 Tax=Muribacter muris TaxID=67855 RepID=A0A0J5P7L9_9PAST|nr:hypothetical protein RO21_06125 [[Actinobacillus] muris] [Muribacter muris]
MLKCLFKGHSFARFDQDRIKCTRCGKVKLMPCNHKWKVIHISTAQESGIISEIVYTQSCSLCGAIKKKPVNF